MMRSALAFSHLLSKQVINSSSPVVSDKKLIFSEVDDANASDIVKTIIENGITTIVYSISDADVFDMLEPYILMVENLEIDEYPGDTLYLNHEYLRNLKSITIPGTIQTIGQSCFQYCKFTSIDLKNVTTVLGAAFFVCRNLETIVAPKLININSQFADYCFQLSSITTGELRSIPAQAFRQCRKLSSINISKITTIGEEAFRYSCITSISIPKDCTEIGKYAFENSALTSIIFDDSQTSEIKINQYAFANTFISSIYLHKAVRHYMFYTGYLCAYCSKLENITFHSSITSIESHFAYMCTNLKSVDAKGITRVGTSAFEMCINLESVTFEKVTRFGYNCCRYCSKLNATFNNNAAIVFDWSSFAFCEKLSFDLMAENWQLDLKTFFGCNGFTSLKLGSQLKSYGTFKGCMGLKSVEILGSITSITENCFQNCTNLESISFTSNLTSIGYSAFASTALKGKYDFTGIHLGYYAFENTKIEEVTIGTGECMVFENCANLKTVNINSSNFIVGPLINTINVEFKFLSGGENITMDNNILLYKFIDNTGTYKHLVVFLPNYNEKTITITDFSSIYPYAFSLCDKITKVIIDGTNVLIKRNAFSYSNVKSIEIKKIGQTYIPQSMCSGKSKIQKIVIPEGVTSISSFAFYSSTELTSVKLPSSIRIISDCAFYYCIKLKSIDLSNVVYIDNKAFSECESLNVEFSENLKDIYNNAFENTNVKNVILPNSLQFLGIHPFQNCRNLKSIKVGNGITWIDRITVDCPKLEKVILPSTIVNISSNSFDNSPSVEVEIDSGNPYFEAHDHVIIEKSTKIVIASYGTLPKEYEVPDGVVSIRQISTNKHSEKEQNDNVYLGISAAIIKYPKSMKYFESVKPYLICSDSEAILLEFYSAKPYKDCKTKLPDYYYWRFNRGMTTAEIVLTVILVLIVVAIITLTIIYFACIKKRKVVDEQNP